MRVDLTTAAIKPGHCPGFFLVFSKLNTPPRGPCSLVKTYRTVNRGLWFVSSGHDLRSTLRAPQLESRTNDHDVRTVDRGPWTVGFFFIFPGRGSATAAAAAPILERRSRGQLAMRFIPAPGIRDFPQIQSLSRGLFSIPRDVGTPGLGSRQKVHELQLIAPDRGQRARLAGSCKGAGFTQTIP